MLKKEVAQSPGFSQPTGRMARVPEGHAVQAPIKDEASREVSFGPDPLDAALRGEMRTLVERLIREELVAALGAGPYERTAERRGDQHSPRERTITTGLGPVTLTVPRGRWFAAPAGGSEEWQSELLPRYARRTREVDAALARLEADPIGRDATGLFNRNRDRTNLAIITGCNDCHTPGSLYGSPDLDRRYSGSELGWTDPWGTSYARNLTPDTETGIGSWSEDDIAKAMRTGQRADGSPLLPPVKHPMPATVPPGGKRSRRPHEARCPIRVKTKTPGR